MQNNLGVVILIEQIFLQNSKWVAAFSKKDLMSKGQPWRSEIPQKIGS